MRLYLLTLTHENRMSRDKICAAHVTLDIAVTNCTRIQACAVYSTAYMALKLAPIYGHPSLQAFKCGANYNAYSFVTASIVQARSICDFHKRVLHSVKLNYPTVECWYTKSAPSGLSQNYSWHLFTQMTFDTHVPASRDARCHRNRMKRGTCCVAASIRESWAPRQHACPPAEAAVCNRRPIRVRVRSRRRPIGSLVDRSSDESRETRRDEAGDVDRGPNVYVAH